MSTMKKIPLKGGVEYDVFSNWRKHLCYTSKAGICKKIKRKYNKRFRKETNHDLKRCYDKTE